MISWSQFKPFYLIEKEFFPRPKIISNYFDTRFDFDKKRWDFLLAESILKAPNIVKKTQNWCYKILITCWTSWSYDFSIVLFTLFVMLDLQNKFKEQNFHNHINFFNID